MRLWALWLLLAFPGFAQASAVFPYKVAKRSLPNGLDLVLIETPGFPGVLSYNTLVLAGSRDELEPGKTGLAHLFEHILFRHRYGGQEGGYDQAIDRLGAHNNAWTWFDQTFYHPLTFKENFAELAALEAERFMRLDFTEKIFKTEAGAVLGEYRKASSSPELRMSEALLGELFPDHPYGHTTLGTYEDVVDMPNEHAAALAFYRDHYRPNNCVVIVAGDLRAEEALPALEKAYAAWERGSERPVPPSRRSASAEARLRVAWDAEVAPQLWLSYRMPAFRPGSKEGAVAQVLGELLVSQAAPLYKELRYEKKTVSTLGLGEGRQGFESVDPRALTLAAQLYPEQLKARGEAYFEEVRADLVAGVEALKSFASSPKAAELLRVIQSRYRYDFLARLESPAEIAGVFAWYYRFARDPEALDRNLESVAALAPADIDAFARAQFTPGNRVVVSMAHDGKAP